MTACYCCDRRFAIEECDCNCLYCRRCLWCAVHCACLVPLLVEDEELADEPVLLRQPQPSPPLPPRLQ